MSYLRYEKEARAKELSIEAKKEAEAKKLLMGREGKGQSEDYKWFCKNCFTEFLIDVPNNQCSRCGNKKLMSQAARRAQIMDKLVL